MLSHVLNVLEDIPTAILTRSFCSNGADSKEDNINECISKVRRSIDDDMIIVTSDLPFFNKETLYALTSESDAVAIGPSHNGGTSGLFIPREIDFTPMFGNDSLERHRMQAEKKNVALRTVESSALRDVDTWDDITWILENASATSIGRFLKGLVQQPIAVV
jgi:2-phospho-L-lactate guanylyltransferase (CobY/MobA/RfbA family)